MTMMLRLVETSNFKKDRKRLKKEGKDLSLLKAIIQTLQEQKPLDKKYKDHKLKGNWKGFRECHVESDWLLIYTVDKEELILTCSRTGSHSEILQL